MLILVCGGVIDAYIKEQLLMPVLNVTYLCQWDFINTNGTVVLDANFKINKSNLSCNFDDFILLAIDRKLIFLFSLPLKQLICMYLFII